MKCRIIYCLNAPNYSHTNHSQLGPHTNNNHSQLEHHTNLIQTLSAGISIKLQSPNDSRSTKTIFYKEIIHFLNIIHPVFAHYIMIPHCFKISQNLVSGSAKEFTLCIHNRFHNYFNTCTCTGTITTKILLTCDPYIIIHAHVVLLKYIEHSCFM